jgi:hypothetical protein
MISWSDVSVCIAAVDVRATSSSEISRTGEVGEVGEGDLLSEWYLDFELCAIHSSCPPSSARNVEGPEVGSTTRGIPTRSGTWLAAPCPFGVAGPTGGNGTSFPM